MNWNGMEYGNYLHRFDTTIPGTITGSGASPAKYTSSGTWRWTFSATGYEDVVVTVIIR